MAVHFKFRSAVDFDSIDVDGNGITLGNLKDRIIQQKNLGRITNFDLVVTNAESGEEYFDDAILVPKHTSVIVKRVPARRAKTKLLVHEHEDESLEHQPSCPSNKDVDIADLALTSPIDELYEMNDFGIDLYAIDESALTNVEADEVSNASALMAKTPTDGKRLTQEIQGYGRDDKSGARGFGYGRATPHAGYVCHRCGQPGHFIQHCPTNGDPAYDLKKGSRLRADCEDLTTLSPTNNLFTQEIDPLPPELRCSLCQGIFKEAVMIPCCQYSFCDTCASQYLKEKGMCPQCASEKPKNGDLLPNVALRQAIDRFTNAQLDTPAPNDGADIESATKASKVLSPQTQLLKTSSTAKDLASVVVDNKQTDLPVVDDSVCESAIGSKEKNLVEGSKVGGFAGDASFVGKKKKRLVTRPGSISDIVAEHMHGKFRKANRFCFVCGSPDHIARNCTANAGETSVNFPPQRAMYHPVGPVPPQAITPFGQDLYWPGPVVHVRPLPLNYGEGMYGPMPYGTPSLPVGPYSVPSYTPSIYPNRSLHGYGVASRVMSSGERPLSREEFMQLQERERRRRLMQERQERDPSEENPGSGAGGDQSMSSASERSLQKQWPAAKKPHGNSWKHDIDSNISKETMVSMRNKQKHSRKLQRPDEHVDAHHYDVESDNDSAFDDYRVQSLHSQKLHQGAKPSLGRKTSKVHERCVSEKANLDWDEGQNVKTRTLKEEGFSKLGKQNALTRYDGIPFEKREHNTYVKHDGTRVSEAGAAELLHLSRHRTKKAAMEAAKLVYSDQQPPRLAAETKKRHYHHSLVSDDGNSTGVERELSVRKNQNQDDMEMVSKVSGDVLRKKRKHKKHKLGGSKDAPEGSGALEGASKKSSRKKHRSSGKSNDENSVVDVVSADIPTMVDTEEERWRMDDGLGDEQSVDQRKRPKHKHRHSSKSAL